MKRTVSMAFFIFLISSQSFAQNIRLNAYGAYVFDDKVDSYFDNNNYYKGTIKGGFQWGVGVEYMTRRNFGIDRSAEANDTLGCATECPILRTLIASV